MNPIALPVAELKPALAGLSKVISKRSTLPVLSHVRVERTATGRLELGVTDLDTALVARLEGPAQGEPVAFLVPYAELHNATKGCRASDSLLLAPVAPQRVALKFPVAGQIIEHRCESLPVEEFPAIAEIHGEPVILDEGLRRGHAKTWRRRWRLSAPGAGDRVPATVPAPGTGDPPGRLEKLALFSPYQERLGARRSRHL